MKYHENQFYSHEANYRYLQQQKAKLQQAGIDASDLSAPLEVGELLRYVESKAGRARAGAILLQMAKD